MLRASLGLPLRGLYFCGPELGNCVFVGFRVFVEKSMDYRPSNLNLESQI